jgi:hypothetical protein
LGFRDPGGGNDQRFGPGLGCGGGEHNDLGHIWRRFGQHDPHGHTVTAATLTSIAVTPATPSAAAGTILIATKVGDNVTFTLNVAQPGTYDVKIGVKEYTTRGIWQMSVNGVNVGAPQDEYLNTGGTYAVLDVGTVTISSAGNQSFKFTVTGKNAASSGFSISFDPITLTPQ